MEENNLNKRVAMVSEFLDIFKDGVISRIIDNKSKQLNYSVNMLMAFFRDNGFKDIDTKMFIDTCNKVISSDRNYLTVGKLEIRNNFIINLS